MRNRTLLLAPALLLAGCSLIQTGTTQRVTIDSKPTGAAFTVNGGTTTYKTPATFEDWPREEHVITFKQKGYLPGPYQLTTRTNGYFYWSFLTGVIGTSIDWISGAWKEFDVDESGKIVFNLRTSAENPEHHWKFTSDPPGATIRIDKIDILERTKPDGLGVPVPIKWRDDNDRERTLELQLNEFYEPAKIKIERGKGERDKDGYWKIHWKFIPKPEEITVNFITTPPGADVIVDGVRITSDQVRTPRDAKILWKPGHTLPRRVEFYMKGYKDVQREIKDKTVREVKVAMEEIVNSVSVKMACGPTGSMVEIDGLPPVPAPEVLTLDWSVTRVRHKLKFTRAGYEPREIVIEEREKHEPISVRLKPSLPKLP